MVNYYIPCEICKQPVLDKMYYVHTLYCDRYHYTKPTIECPICFEKTFVYKKLSCGHIFCNECIDSWFRQQKREKTCPYCNSKILY